MLVRLTNGVVNPIFERPGFWRQLSTLLRRDAVVAIRDPTLYYLQVSLLVSLSGITGEKDRFTGQLRLTYQSGWGMGVALIVPKQCPRVDMHIASRSLGHNS